MAKTDKQKPRKETIVTDAAENSINAEEVVAEVIEEETNEDKSEQKTVDADETSQVPPHSFSDKISAATDKGVAIAKDIFDKARHYSTEAVDLTRLKIDLYNLKADRDRIFKKMGKQLWQLYKDDKFRGIKATFSEEFELMQSLEAKIAAKEEEIEKINF